MNVYFSLTPRQSTRRPPLRCLFPLSHVGAALLAAVFHLIVYQLLDAGRLGCCIWQPKHEGSLL